MMFASILVWLVIGSLAGVLSAMAGPQDSFGLPGDIAIGIAGAVAGGLFWPMFGVFTGTGLTGTMIGGVAGVALALPAMRMIRPDLITFLYPKP